MFHKLETEKKKKQIKEERQTKIILVEGEHTKGDLKAIQQDEQKKSTNWGSRLGTEQQVKGKGAASSV